MPALLTLLGFPGPGTEDAAPSLEALWDQLGELYCLILVSNRLAHDGESLSLHCFRIVTPFQGARRIPSQPRKSAGRGPRPLTPDQGNQDRLIHPGGNRFTRAGIHLTGRGCILSLSAIMEYFPISFQKDD